MFLLSFGVVLWWAAHFFKRVAPARRAALGDRGRGIVALFLLVSAIMMILGYRAADGAFFWGRSPALTGVNNLLMLVSIYLFAADGMKTRITRYVRHPQLTAFSIWCVAHLLVNGDMPSFILFGGLLGWALVSIAVLNRAQPEWTPPEPGPARKEAMAAAGAVIVFAAIAAVHTWLGYYPLG